MKSHVTKLSAPKERKGSKVHYINQEITQSVHSSLKQNVVKEPKCTFAKLNKQTNNQKDNNSHEM